MKLFIPILLLTILTSCGFSSSDDENTEKQTTRVDPFKPSTAPKEDFDGDLITNQEELNMGRNPYIADLPDTRVRFLQNYKIEVIYKNIETQEEGSFSIDTKLGANDPTFKYRVGNVYLRDNSYKSAAMIGEFNTHSWGEYKKHDLSWVKYPDIDSRFFQSNVMKYSQFFNSDKYEISNVIVELENSIKLRANTSYKAIKDISVSYRFYNYETENFEVLHNEKIERHFNAGTNELFKTRIENVNPRLISENYFKKGEFIISELTDYEIPELNKSYKALMMSVNDKTVPVVYNTPLETQVQYVALREGLSFNDIMTILFDKKYTIENNTLIYINQFKNSLPEYTYLSELKDMDKKGNWFVFTNRLNKHYLDHEFKKDDVISLSYILGRDLAAQAEEKIFSFRENVSSSDHYQTYTIGNTTPNSEVNIFLTPKARFGEKIKHFTDVLRNRGCGGRRNCISHPFRCDLSFNIFEALDEKYQFNKEFKGEISRLGLVINGEEFSLVSLINEKKVKINWMDNGISLHIKNINLIKELSNVEENILSIKLHALRENHFNGVKLVNMTGRASYMCPMHTTNIAGHNSWPLSVESKDFGNWAHTVRWDKVKRGDKKTLIQQFSLGITSVISNYFN